MRDSSQWSTHIIQSGCSLPPGVGSFNTQFSCPRCPAAVLLEPQSRSAPELCVCHVCEALHISSPRLQD